MYHRVALLPGYTYPIAVSPERFRQHMAHLKQHYQPLPLGELADALGGGSIPRRAVAITFDDGYADNYLNALPILSDLGVPATVFVSSGYIDDDREYWWDDLERILLSSHTVPRRLELAIQGQRYSWASDSTERRRSLRKELHRVIKPLVPEEREQILDVLANWAGRGRSARPEHRSLTRDELRHLASNPLVEIGGHTVDHPQLAAIPLEKQYREISEGRDELERIIGKRIKTFSYPYGGSGDFTAETTDLVRQAGFMAACSTRAALATTASDLFRLPRYWVGDWGIDQFQKEISGFFEHR